MNVLQHAGLNSDLSGGKMPEFMNSLPDGASLQEILSDELGGDMMFEEVLAVTVITKNCSVIVKNFPLERKKHIQRFRSNEDGTKTAIVSYIKEEMELIKQKLSNIGIEAPVLHVKIPMWYPIDDHQKEMCRDVWPIAALSTNMLPPPLPIDEHVQYILEVIKNRSVIVKKPNVDAIISQAPSDCALCDGYRYHGVLKCMAEASAKNFDSGSYLCTDLDVYIYKEPCCMCTMALTHSRIGRLFYVEDNISYGGIRSQVRIHCCPRINHRYRAFKLKI